MKKGIWPALIALLLVSVIIAVPVVQSELMPKKTTASSAVEKSNRIIVESSDKETLQPRNSNTEIKDETVTFMVLLGEAPMIDKMLSSSKRADSVREFILSEEGKAFCDAVKKSQAVAKASIKKLVPEAVLDGGRTFSALFNGITVRAPVSSREKLEKLKGVSGVFVLRDDNILFDSEISFGIQKASAENARKLMEAQRTFAGIDDDLLSQYGGTGSLIAVIDNGFDTDADVFSENPAADNMPPAVISELNKRLSFNISSDGSSASLYLSPKIVFAYDYAEKDNDTESEKSSHGTAAASIAAGNNGENAQIPYRGIAYDAQLALMKIADRNNKIITEAFIAALDDAVKLGADIVNIGFGSYEQSEITELLSYAFEKMRRTGMTVITAAGNGAYNGYETGKKPAAEDIFYSSGNVLSQKGGVISAGSAESSVTVRKSILINGTKLYYTDLNDKSLSSSVGSVKNIGTALDVSENRAQYNEYIFVRNYSGKETLSDMGIEGKMVILDVSGMTEPEAACHDAAEKGAVSAALIGLANDAQTEFGDAIPVVRLEDAESSLFSSAAEGTFTMDLEGEVTEKRKAPSVSGFTSYGVSDNLDMGARIIAPGEEILAAAADGKYELFSGTSSAAPCVAGAYAVLKQYIKSRDSFAVYNGQGTSEFVSSVMLSSASPIKYGSSLSYGNVLYYSPRLQGFGAMDIKNALSAQAHFYSASGLASVKLGDGERDSLSFGFVLCNDADEPRSFSLSCAVQTDKAGTDGDGAVMNTLEPMSLDGFSTVTFYSGDEQITELVLDAGTSAEITAEINIETSALASLKEKFTAGFYIEGYVFASAGSGTVSLPFMSFYGALGDAAVFDRTVYDEEASVTGLESSLVAAAYKYGSHASCGLVRYNDRLLFSIEAVRSSEDDTAYSNAVILPDLYTLSNAYDLTIRIYDLSGRLLITEYLGDFTSHRYPDSRPYERLNVSRNFREFFSKLSRGSYRYEISARNMLSDGSLSAEKRTSYQFELDNVKPEGVSSETFSENGRLYLELTASDSGGILDFELYGAAYDNKNGKYNYIDSLDSIIEAGYIAEKAYTPIEKRVNENGSFTFRYDITDLSRELRKLSIDTDTWTIKSLYKKIAYKAIDNAGNSSEVRIADAIEYGSAEFIFTDQNGRPAPGIGVSIGNSIIYSDSRGRAFFEKIEPTYYYASLHYDADLYNIETDRYLVSVTKDKLEYKIEQSVEYFGVYPEEQYGDDIVTEKTRADSFMEDQEKDEPVYAFVFVGSVLAVCIMLFIIRKRIIR